MNELEMNVAAAKMLGHHPQHLGDEKSVMIPVVLNEGEYVTYTPFNIFIYPVDCLAAIECLFDRYELELRQSNGIYYWAVRIRCGEGFIDGSADTLQQAIGAACVEVMKDDH
ncbi:MAG: hypothetical protein D6732_03015 [Methanobacteriota archaeon]|nr:MAG: hypothetical protein D6732_03015 [Euryarchaeota archaeon]